MRHGASSYKDKEHLHSSSFYLNWKKKSSGHGSNIFDRAPVTDAQNFIQQNMMDVDQTSETTYTNASQINLTAKNNQTSGVALSTERNINQS